LQFPRGDLFGSAVVRTTSPKTGKRETTEDNDHTTNVSDL